jgi:stage V sporulation protein AA
VKVMVKTVYLRLCHRIQVDPNETVTIGDIAQIVAEPELEKTIKKTVIHRVNMKDKNYVVIDVMQVISKMKQIDENLDIQTIGPSQTIIEIIYKKSSLSMVYFIAVWLLLFIGSALAIMNFHEDVSMQQVHQKIYSIITGKKEEKPLLLQIPYSIGLGLGMILFFNHVFRKRINEEPSPLEVEMFNYQQDLDHYLIMHENKESMRKIK